MDLVMSGTAENRQEIGGFFLGNEIAYRKKN